MKDVKEAFLCLITMYVPGGHLEFWQNFAKFLA